MPFLFFLLVLIGFLGCKPTEKEYVYELNEIKIKEAGAAKTRVKTDMEFLSVAYTDLFERTITQSELTVFLNSYNSVGDKTLVTDMIIRTFINSKDAKIPTMQEMKRDPDAFIRATYRKFYVREPGEYEKWYWVKQINENATLTPQLVYYAFLTSTEYKFY